MASSRLGRIEVKKAKKRMGIAIVGSAALILFMALFGFRVLVGFSLLVDRLRGGTPAQPAEQAILFPPVLDPLPEATNSATLHLTARGEAGKELIIYLNDTEFERYPVPESGTVAITDVTAPEGDTTLYARLYDTATQTESDPSNTVSTTIDKTPPKLEVSAPNDNSTVNDGTHRVPVAGSTDADARVTISGRIVIVRSDGSFSYAMPIADGPNILDIIAKDPAGNETKITRSVTYVP